MPIQQFTINTRDNMVGNLYGISYTSSIRHTYSNKNDTDDAAPIPFGVAVKQGSEDRWCELGGGSAAVILGLSVRQINREPDDRPSSGNISFRNNEELTVLRDGFMTVKVVGGTAAVGGRVYVNATTGAISADATGNVLTTNMRWGSSGEVNTNAVVEISSATMFDA